MTPDRTRHLVEGALADQGWRVYRLVLGRGPALVAMREDGRPVVVAVARASEPKGPDGPSYPRLEKATGADALASVTSAGVVTFHDPEGVRPSNLLGDVLSGDLRRFEVQTQDAVNGGPLSPTAAYHEREPCPQP